MARSQDTPAVPDIQLDADDELVRTGKDATATRRALVRAARRRFAVDGYRAATVRHIAADAGVNVALINRYFGSKEGLFEACMNRTADELNPEDVATGPAATTGTEKRPDIGAVIDRIVAHAVNSDDTDDPLRLLLLLRSSGDENADLIRRRTLESYTERIALSAGWTAGDSATDHLLLRAQMAIGTLLGMVMLRASAKVQPLSAATRDELAGPLSQVLRTLLDPPAPSG